jgi:DNA-binding NtrC family response regulator
MTGDFANEEVMCALRERGKPWLEKPFTLDELVETVRTALGERTELDPG